MTAAERRRGIGAMSWSLLFVALVIPVFALLRDARSSLRRGDALPRFGAVPRFALVDQSGRPVTDAELSGAPWFANFVYTSCQGSCPVLSGEMAKLGQRVGDRARLVSFTVDPARDTPETLHAYAERFGATAGRWLFVGGDVGAMRSLIRDGFHLAVVDAPADAGQPPGTITHSEKVVLVDGGMTIRRYYDGGDGRWIDDAVADLDRLEGSSAEARS
jgi:protein SCO1/2